MGLTDVKEKHALLLTESLLNPDTPTICQKCQIRFLYDHNGNIMDDVHIKHPIAAPGNCESSITLFSENDYK